MPLKTSTTLHKRQQVYSAIDSTHHSVLRLLLLLSQSPTTTTTHISANEEIASLFLEKEENQQQPKYFGNREAFYRAKEAEDNELLRLEWTQEDEEIRQIREEWRYECHQGESSDEDVESDDEEIKQGFHREGATRETRERVVQQ